jgi:hypothetical protein
MSGPKCKSDHFICLLHFLHIHLHTSPPSPPRSPSQ